MIEQEMKVLSFTQLLMKVCGILPTFDDTCSGKCMEILKLIIVFIGPFMGTVTSFAYSLNHSDDLRLLTSALYVSIGSSMSIVIEISLWLQTDDIQDLLKQLESLVNKSKYLQKKYAGVIW